MARIGKLVLGTATATAMLLAGGLLDVPMIWLGNAAQAIELFGSDEDGEDDIEGSFWTEGSGREPIVPLGVPASFGACPSGTARYSRSNTGRREVFVAPPPPGPPR